MNINKMTRKQFEELPLRPWDEQTTCECVVLLPTRHMHDSGYRCMDFVAVRNDEPIYRMSGCSDVLHIDGIGGYGAHWLEKYGHVPNTIPPSSWNIDCLPKSGLFRIWAGNGDVLCDRPFSSFEIFKVDRAPKK